jgi:serine/threonine protein kinase
VSEEVGFYSVSGALGAGQGGVVRRGLHRTTGVAVAVKSLKKKYFSAVSAAWPGREMSVMRNLNHANIVQLLDCVAMPNCHHLILELVDGGELLSYCFDSGRLPEATARPIFRDILNAVDYIHRKGIAHRDLKLENCLIDSATKRVKLIDFGLANFFLPGQHLKTSCGSPDYAAPELLGNMEASYLGPSVDVWALGVMLYAMCCGAFPFCSVSETLEGRFKWPGDLAVSKTLKNLIGSVFETSPAARITTTLMRQHEWTDEGIFCSDLQAEQKTEVVKVRADVLAHMESAFALPMEAVAQSLIAEEINTMTATYKLLTMQHCTL